MTDKKMPDQITVWQYAERVFPDDLQITEAGPGMLIPQDMKESEYIRADLVSGLIDVPVIKSGSWTNLDGLTEHEASAVCAAYGRSVGFSEGHNKGMVIIKEGRNPYRSAKIVKAGATDNLGLHVQASDIIAALPQLITGGVKNG